MTSTSNFGRDSVNYADASRILDIPEGTIRTWKARRQVVPVGIANVHQRGSRDVPLFVLAELQPLADEYHQRRAERATRAAAVADEADVVT